MGDLLAEGDEWEQGMITNLKPLWLGNDDATTTA